MNIFLLCTKFGIIYYIHRKLIKCHRKNTIIVSLQYFFIIFMLYNPPIGIIIQRSYKPIKKSDVQAKMSHVRGYLVQLYHFSLWRIISFLTLKDMLLSFSLQQTLSKLSWSLLLSSRLVLINVQIYKSVFMRCRSIFSLYRSNCNRHNQNQCYLQDGFPTPY